MGYVITANLAKGRKVTTEPVFRWNHGMVLKFIGVTLPDNYRVDFSNTLNGTAKSQMGTAANGVVIPDEYFMPGQTIFAWVVLSPTENSAITEFQVSIPIDPKAKATGIDPAPQQESVIDQAISAMNTTIAKANEAVSHYPMIVDEYWYVWDVAAGEYVTTGIKSTGEDGYSPTVTVTEITGGHQVTITDKNGDHVFNVLDGTNGENGVTFTPSVSSAGVISWTNNGSLPNPESVNIKGPPGDDGVSPAVTIASITGGHSVTITDADHPNGQTFDVMDGAPGTGISVHICSAAEYDSTTRVPTVQNPEANTFYLVPAENGASPDMFVEWIFTNNAWEMFGSATVEVPVQDVQVNGTSVLDAQGVANVPLASATVPGVVVSGSIFVSGTTPVITALAGIQYVCGECATLDITLPASGCVDVVFESGSTPTVLTITPPTGMTVEWANGFDSTALEADTLYEMNIKMVGTKCLGVAGSWT